MKVELWSLGFSESIIEFGIKIWFDFIELIIKYLLSFDLHFELSLK